MDNEAPIDLILVRMRAFDERLRALESRVEELHGRLGEIRPPQPADRRAAGRRQPSADQLAEHMARIERRLWSAEG